MDCQLLRQLFIKYLLILILLFLLSYLTLIEKLDAFNNGIKYSETILNSNFRLHIQYENLLLIYFSLIGIIYKISKPGRLIGTR